MNQDGYIINETIGRTQFESLLNQAKNANYWQPTTDKYNHVDGYFYLDNKKIVVEIKTRDKKYADYPTHLMELDKYMNLTKAMVDHNCFTGYYANFFEDTLYLYDLRNINTINCKITERYVSRTTVEDNGKKMKKFLELPAKLAKVFKKENNKWIRIK